MITTITIQCVLITNILLFLALSLSTTNTFSFTPKVTNASVKHVITGVESDSTKLAPSPLNYARGDDKDLLSSSRSPELMSSFITSPVLKQAYFQLLDWKQIYGHPNIPLTNNGGKACQVLRRLRVQNKLLVEEVEWLDSIGFNFHSYEDMYTASDFGEMFDRLVLYESNHPGNNFQVPKKCEEDPELGAWVTGIRRLGKDGVNPEHERRLCEINFAWKSERKCGSKFMIQYRDYVQQAEQVGRDKILQNHETILWIQAQQRALKRGSLSQTRVTYMETLFGENWQEIPEN